MFLSPRGIDCYATFYLGHHVISRDLDLAVFTNRLENEAQIVVLPHFGPKNKNKVQKYPIYASAQLRHWGIS